MRRFWVPVVVLGVAGFDPVGAFTFMGAAAVGATKRKLALLAVTSVGTSVVLSLLAVLGLGATIHSLLERLHVHPSREQQGWALLVGGLILLGWGILRAAGAASGETRADHDETQTRTPRSLSASGMAVAGLLVGVTSLADPAWYAMVAFASSLRHPVGAMVTALVWCLMSHIVLVVLALSLLVGWYERVHRWLDTVRTKYRRQLASAITAVLVAGGVGGVVIGMLRLFRIDVA